MAEEKAFVLSDADLNLLKEMAQVHKNRRLNPPLTTDADVDLGGSDIYIARPQDPEVGIPGVTPAGTFQDEEGFDLPVLDEPGVALCTLYQIANDIEAVNEVQILSLNGATGGTFTLSYGGQTTGPLESYATEAEVQSALQALSNLGAGNISTTGGPFPDSDMRVEFGGSLAFTNVPQITINTANLVGNLDEVEATTELQGSAKSYGGIVDTGLEEEVYNLSQSPIIEAYVLVVRDSYGTLIAKQIEDYFEGILLQQLDPATGPLTGASEGLMLMIQKDYPFSSNASVFAKTRLIRGFHNRALSMSGRPGTYGRCRRMNGETRLEYLDCAPSEEGVQIIIEYEEALVNGGYGSGSYGDGTFGG